MYPILPARAKKDYGIKKRNEEFLPKFRKKENRMYYDGFEQQEIYGELVAVARSEARRLGTRVPKPGDQLAGSPSVHCLRYDCITPMPVLDARTQQIEWGTNCAGCQQASSKSRFFDQSIMNASNKLYTKKALLSHSWICQPAKLVMRDELRWTIETLLEDPVLARWSKDEDGLFWAFLEEIDIERERVDLVRGRGYLWPRREWGKWAEREAVSPATFTGRLND